MVVCFVALRQCVDHKTINLFSFAMAWKNNFWDSSRAKNGIFQIASIQRNGRFGIVGTKYDSGKTV